MKKVRGLIFLGIFIILVSGFVFAGDLFGLGKSPVDEKDVRLSDVECLDGIEATIDTCENRICVHREITDDVCEDDDDCDDGLGQRSEECNTDGFCERSYSRGECGARTYTCSDDQTIMKLSSITNAHGALGNLANSIYSVDICYNEIFGKNFEYTSSSSIDVVRLCDPQNLNKITDLTLSSNAHSKNSGTIPVCYADLVCEVVSGTGTPSPGKSLVISLSALSNGHIAADDSYPFKIYCSSHFAAEIIPTNTCTDDGVCAVGEGCNCADCLATTNPAVPVCGATLRCDVVDNNCYDPTVPLCDEDETLCYDRTCSEDCGEERNVDFACDNNNICGALLGSDGMPVLDNNGNQIIESCQCGDCYGRADSCGVSGTAPNEKQMVCDFRTNSCQPCPEGSVYDTTTQTGTCVPNPAPLIEILGPKKYTDVNDFNKFQVNTEIKFNQTIPNSNILLRDVKAEWNFGVVPTTVIEKCLTSGNCNTSYTYQSSGYKVARVNAIEMGGESRKASDYTKFLVYKSGLNLFAIITKPEVGAIIENNIPVEFDASNSFVAECFSGENACKAGARGDPQGPTLSPILNCYKVADLWCYDYPKPDDPRYPLFGEYELTFDWTFDKGRTEERKSNGVWTNNSDAIVKFDRAFQGVRGTNHTAELIINYKYNG